MDWNLNLIFLEFTLSFILNIPPNNLSSLIDLIVGKMAIVIIHLLTLFVFILTFLLNSIIEPSLTQVPQKEEKKNFCV